MDHGNIEGPEDIETTLTKSTVIQLFRGLPIRATFLRTEQDARLANIVFSTP